MRARGRFVIVMGATCVAAGAMTAGLLTAGLGAGAAAPAPSPATTTRSATGISPQAAGVNEGTKRQGAAVVMRPARTDSAGDDRLAGVAGATGGCTPGYGRGRACLPLTPLSVVRTGGLIAEARWTCAELRSLIPAGIRLDARGQDPLLLDRNGDGTACGAGD